MYDAVSFKDAVQIKLSKKVDNQGFLRSRVRIARVGTQYYKDYGNIMRSTTTLQKSADSFNNQVVTLGHPKDSVDSSNSSQYQIGFITNVKVAGKWLVGDIVITDKASVDEVLSNRAVEFSCGYTADIIAKEGDYLGIHYSYEFDNVVGNHVALVNLARAGHDATFIDSKSNNIPIDRVIDMTSKTDKSNETLEVSSEVVTNDMAGSSMPDYESRFKSIEDSISKMMDMMTAMQAVSTTTKTGGVTDSAEEAPEEVKAPEVKVEVKTNDSVDTIENLKAKIDILETKLAKVSDSKESNLDGQEIAARVEVWSIVKPLLVDSVDVDYSLPVTQVRKLYLAQQLPHLKGKISDGADAYINGLWDCYYEDTKVEDTEAEDSTVEDTKVEDTKAASIYSEVLSLPVIDSAQDSFAEAQNAYMERLSKNRG